MPADARQTRTGRGRETLPRGATHSARQVLFHLGVLDTPAPPRSAALSLRRAHGRRSCSAAPRVRGLPEPQTRHLRAQDGQQPGDPAGAFRPVPRRRSTPTLTSLAATGPTPPHRTVPHLADRPPPTATPASRSPSPTGSRRVHAVGELPRRDHRVGMGRRATAAAGVPHRSPAAAATRPAPVSARRRRPPPHRGAVDVALPAGRRRAAAATRLRAAHRRAARPRTRLRPRDPRARHPG